MIEQVQSNFVHYLKWRGFINSLDSYSASCKTLDLLTLAERRTLMEILIVYQIINGRSPHRSEIIRWKIPYRNARSYRPFICDTMCSLSPVFRCVKKANDYYSELDLFVPAKNHLTAEFRNRVTN